MSQTYFVRGVLVTVGFTLISTLAPISAACQQTRPEAGSVTVHADRRFDLLRGIALTAQQRATIDSIQAHYDSLSSHVRRKATSAAWEVTVMMPITLERQEAIRAVLTPAQRTIYNNNIAELREWMRREGHH